VLRIRRELLEETFEHFRSCGRGRRECVAYWLGPRDADGQVTGVVHPRHSATATSYDVDGSWVTEFWLRLAEDGLALLAQVHTHPDSAFHSSRDDDRAALQTAGFVSLVIPRFGQGAVSLDGTHLALRGRDGAWATVAVPSDEIEVT
jgi:YD repeat-containing protein